MKRKTGILCVAIVLCLAIGGAVLGEDYKCPWFGCSGGASCEDGGIWSTCARIVCLDQTEIVCHPPT
jgi:hypothetical protein